MRGRFKARQARRIRARLRITFMPNLRQPALIAVVALLASNLIAGVPVPVAPPGTGPMPGVASSISVVFSAADGFAIWRVGFSDVWGVPLDLGGRPTGPARLIIDDPRGTEGPVVQWTGGAYVAWWGNGYPSLSQTVRINPDGMMSEVPNTLEARATPAAWNDEVTLAFGNADNGHDRNRLQAAASRDCERREHSRRSLDCGGVRRNAAAQNRHDRCCERHVASANARQRSMEEHHGDRGDMERRFLHRGGHGGAVGGTGN